MSGHPRPWVETPLEPTESSWTVDLATCPCCSSWWRQAPALELLSCPRASLSSLSLPCGQLLLRVGCSTQQTVNWHVSRYDAVTNRRTVLWKVTLQRALVLAASRTNEHFLPIGECHRFEHLSGTKVCCTHTKEIHVKLGLSFILICSQRRVSLNMCSLSQAAYNSLQVFSDWWVWWSISLV